MKRRNGECAKLRRPVKRNKITDGIYGSTVLYLKFFVLWALVLLADFLLEFRFEFLWPFWLLLRSVYDSYKYQGLAFSVFFVSIALTSDMICYFFIPVQWLFFAASTYVWVQYVWHTEKGICLPTVVLWLLFAYMEAAVRLRDLRHMPFHLDLCRPFAAHCIGYPVVTLGFGFKSYVSYRIRQRRQRDVRKENGFYMNLLSQALPIEAVQTQSSPGPEKSKGSGTLVETTSNGVAHGVSNSHGCGSKGSSHRKSLDKGEKATDGYANGTVHNAELEFTERPRTLTEVEEPEVEKEKTTKGSGRNSNKEGRGGGGHCNVGNSREVTGGGSFTSNQRRRANREQAQHHDTQPHRDEYYLRLEADVKRLKGELQSSKQNEQELRAQVNSLVASEKLVKQELSTLQNHNDELVNKVQTLSSQRHNEKATVSALERRLGEERRTRASLEVQLAAERKARAALTAAAAAASSNNANRVECTEACRGRRRELEAEVKQLRRELKIKEERCANTDRELQSLLPYKESHNEAELLMQALSALQDKNSHLENSLSAETRIKLDLFSALGEAKRLLEIRESMIRAQERELEELKGKMAQVLAVMPTDFGSVSTTSKLRLGGGGGAGVVVEGNGPTTATAAAGSALDPNASVYTPKQGHLTTEA